MRVKEKNSFRFSVSFLGKKSPVDRASALAADSTGTKGNEISVAHSSQSSRNHDR